MGKKRTNKVGKKTCNKCKKPLPLDAFNKDATTGDGKGSKCRKCCSKYAKAWRKKNANYQRAWRAAHPEENRAYDEKYRAARPLRGRHKTVRQYGLTLEWFLKRLVKLENRCERCRSKLKSGIETHVDHDHDHCVTCRGRWACGPEGVRGILCPSCSTLLSVKWCRANPGDRYLQEYRERLAMIEEFVSRFQRKAA